MKASRNNIDVSELKHLRNGVYRAFEGEMYGYPVCILAEKNRFEERRLLLWLCGSSAFSFAVSNTLYGQDYGASR